MVEPRRVPSGEFTEFTIREGTTVITGWEYRSGSYKKRVDDADLEGIASEVREEIDNILREDINNALDDMKRDFSLKYAPSVARKTGRMVNTLIESVSHEFENAKTQEGNTVIVDLRGTLQELINIVKYARYHIDGTPGNPGKEFYDDPSKTGTSPIDTGEFGLFVFKNAIARIQSRIRLSGLDSRRTE